MRKLSEPLVSLQCGGVLMFQSGFHVLRADPPVRVGLEQLREPRARESAGALGRGEPTRTALCLCCLLPALCPFRRTPRARMTTVHVYSTGTCAFTRLQWILPELVNERAAPLPGPPGRFANHTNGARPPATRSRSCSLLHSCSSRFRSPIRDSVCILCSPPHFASAGEPLPPSYQRRRPDDYLDENDLYREVNSLSLLLYYDELHSHLRTLHLL